MFVKYQIENIPIETFTPLNSKYNVRKSKL